MEDRKKEDQKRTTVGNAEPENAGPNLG